MSDYDHIRLVLPGPVEVRREILDAQADWMIGHRSKAFADQFAHLQENLKQAFLTMSRVYISTSSGSGLWEGASRNCVRDDQKVLHLVCGAFSERWADVSRMNGKQVDVVSVDWGKPITPDLVADALKKGHYDAVAVVHNETSTGVTNPLAEIAEVVNAAEDTLLLVDTVSGFLGAELRVNNWGVDVALTSSQKAFALPPGLSFAAVSDRALERAKQVEYRGYYFDFLTFEKYLLKNNTPSTPPISLLFAADRQLNDIMSEGLEQRWQRHLTMRDRTIEWTQSRGFDLFAKEGYRSPTVTTVANNLGIDVTDLTAFMLTRGWAIDKGYGQIKGKTFRVPHMGDMTMDILNAVLADIDAYLEQH